MTDVESALYHESDCFVWIFGTSKEIIGTRIRDFVKKIDFIESIKQEDGIFSYPCHVESKWIDSKTKRTKIKGVLKEYGRFELEETWCLDMCDDCRRRSLLLTCTIIKE